MDGIAGEPFDRAERDLGEWAAGVSLCVETTFRTSMYGGIYATATFQHGLVLLYKISGSRSSALAMRMIMSTFSGVHYWLGDEIKL